MTQTSLHWHWLRFDQLTSPQLYEMLAERQRVFVLEQKCFYVDADGRDQDALHLLGYETLTHTQKLCAYLRVFPPASNSPCTIGRVFTIPERRGQGLGRILMKKGLAQIHSEFGPTPIQMSAQSHLEKFYNEFGFTRMGETYLEDGIPHIKMGKQS